MEQKEQKVVRPKVTVTVEKNGKTSVSEGKSGICFLLNDNGVEVVSAYSCTDVEMAALIDSMMRYGTRQMVYDEKLVDSMQKLQRVSVEKSLFDDVAQS